MPPLNETKYIRQHMRYVRKILTIQEQKQASHLLVKQASNFLPIVNANRVTLFSSIDGEIDTQPLLLELWKQKKLTYLPVLHPFLQSKLLFIKCTKHTLLKRNKFGILEPSLDDAQITTINQLDIIFVPLVAFDNQGRRLGMGGGFYDRMLKNWNQNNFLPIGIAHDCQKVESLPFFSWDVPLPVILTPSKIWQWERNKFY